MTPEDKDREQKKTVEPAAPPAAPPAAADLSVVSLEAVCGDFKAAPLLSLARVPGVTGGRLDGSLSVRDSLVHPIVTFEGSVRSLSKGSLSVPEIECELRLDRRALEARGIIVL